jgi:hypothetical protein
MTPSRRPPAITRLKSAHSRHVDSAALRYFRALFLPAHYFSKTWRRRQKLRFTVFMSIQLVNESLIDRITELIQSTHFNHKMFQGTSTAQIAPH